jgi:NADPH:quinone reductase-like Zn-dependent oxidoreductase
MKFAGVVSSTGPSVTTFKPGDRVYGFTYAGRCAAEYVLLSQASSCSASSPRYQVSKIPDSLSFEEAAALFAHTAVGGLLRADAELEGGLKGKTVLVPGGLGGVSSIALQLLKPMFGVGRVVTTVSTAKVPLIESILGTGLVDQIIDYSNKTADEVVSEVGRAEVDFFFDTVGVAMPYLEVVKQEKGFLLGIVGKSGQTLRKEFPMAPWWMVWGLDFVDWVQKCRLLFPFVKTVTHWQQQTDLCVDWMMEKMLTSYTGRASRYGVRFDHIHTQMTDENAEKIARWVQEGKLKAIIGGTGDMTDLEFVKEALDTVGSTKGAIGRIIIRIN